MKKVIVILVLVSGCAWLGNAARTTIDIARCICEKVLSENPDQLGALSVEEYCEKEELLRPFIDDVLAAEKKAGVRLGNAE